MESLTLTSSYLFSTLDQKSSLQYLQDFYERMTYALENHYKNDTTCTIAFSATFEASLNHFSGHRADLPDSLKPVLARLDTTRQYHLESILKWFDGFNGTVLSQPEHRHSCGVNLECLAQYSDLLAIHPNLQEISGRLFSDDGPFQTLKALGYDETPKNPGMAHEDCCTIEYLAVCLAKVELRLYAYDYNLHPNLAHVCGLFKKLRSHHERNNLLSHFKDIMPILGLQSKKELCFQFCIDQKEYLDYSQLLRIQIGLSFLKGNANPRSLSTG